MRLILRALKTATADETTNTDAATKDEMLNNLRRLQVRMKLEAVKDQLESWGEVIITTDAGEKYEIHLGDTQFDLSNRTLTLTTPQAEYVIDGDAVENVKKHYGHPADE